MKKKNILKIFPTLEHRSICIGSGRETCKEFLLELASYLTKSIFQIYSMLGDYNAQIVVVVVVVVVAVVVVVVEEVVVVVVVVVIVVVVVRRM